MLVDMVEFFVVPLTYIKNHLTMMTKLAKLRKKLVLLNLMAVGTI